MTGRLILAAVVFSTFFCTAVNCYTWRLAYPLWHSVDDVAFARLHAAYLRLLGPAITLPHVVAFFSSAALLWHRPWWVSLRGAAAVFIVVTLVILLSAFVAGPVHSRFTRQGRTDAAGMRLLWRVSAVRSLLLLAASAWLIGAVTHPL